LNLQRVNDRVEQIFPEQREVLLADGERLPWDRLLLATGALAVPPAFAGGDLQGVVKLDGLDDIRKILPLAKRSQPAVVVGGGITALELVEGLNARGMTVHYFLRGDRYWAEVLDEAESQLVMDRLRHEGVILHLKTQVKKAFGSKGKLTGVETLEGERVPCQMLAVAIGVRPRIDLARQAGVAVDKGILVNRHLQTSKPDIYAAGDAAQVGNAPLDVLWPIALAQGRIAGHNMAGGKAAYVKGVAHNVTQLTGLKVTIIGAVGRQKNAPGDADLVTIARGDSESWRMSSGAWSIADGDDVNRIRLFLSENRIVGALVIGEQSWSRPLQKLITGEADITPIRQRFNEDAHRALQHLADFYEQWERAHDSAGSRPSAGR
jgi:NAD(P)H-nitrite reductase large subunit